MGVGNEGGRPELELRTPVSVAIWVASDDHILPGSTREFSMATRKNPKEMTLHTSLEPFGQEAQRLVRERIETMEAWFDAEERHAETRRAKEDAEKALTEADDAIKLCEELGGRTFIVRCGDTFRCMHVPVSFQGETEDSRIALTDTFTMT